MILTIIETGKPPEAIRDQHKSYPDMFADLLGAANPELRFQTIALEDGEALPDPETLDGLLITGSAYGVYDDVSWMRTLKAWIGFVADAQIPLIGICFGHQVIADALGGDVRKSDKGWGIGRHTYEVQTRPHWMNFAIETFSVGVSHQDQVISPPVDTDVIAGNTFCRNAALLYRRGPILSFQGHPEFEDRFLEDLYTARKGRPLTEEQVATAKASLKRPHDNKLIAEWMVAFLRSTKKGHS